MALILSAASGNFNAGATWVGGVVPTTGDEARASTGHTITITANATCTEISNAGTGTYVLNSGVTLTANVTNKSLSQFAGCLSFSGVSPATATIVGNVTGGVSTNGSHSAGTGAILNSNTGTLIVQGNVVGGSNVLCNGAFNASTGTIAVTGNVTGGTGTQCNGIYNLSTGAISISGNVAGGSGASGVGAINNAAGTYTITGNVSGTVASAVTNTGGGTVNITGNVTGGTAVNSYGVSNPGTGTINVTGNVTGGTVVATSHGLYNALSGIVAIVGICTGGTSGAAGAVNAATGTVRATRAKGNAYGPSNSAGLVGAVGISNVAIGICEIEQFEFGTFGQSPTSGTGIRLKKANTNVAVFNYCDTAGAKTLIDATANSDIPAATDVRSGVSYASGAATGSCAVPAAGSVALGVPVDAGFGTAVLTPEAVWGAATRTLTSASGPTAADNATAVWAAASRTITGGTVDTLTNAPSVPSASAIASQVRSELSVELSRIDAATSTRATPASIPTSDITAIKGKTDLLNTTRLAQTATTEIVGNLLAQANS